MRNMNQSTAGFQTPSHLQAAALRVKNTITNTNQSVNLLPSQHFLNSVIVHIIITNHSIIAWQNYLAKRKRKTFNFFIFKVLTYI
jgi:hypothetical protein